MSPPIKKKKNAVSAPSPDSVPLTRGRFIRDLTRERLRPLWPALLVSYVALTVSFEPLNFYPLIFFAMVPYFRWLAETRSKRQALQVSFLFGWVFSLGQFYWVNTVLAQFSGLSYVVTIPLFLIFAGVAQAQFWALALPMRTLLRALRRPENGVFTRLGLVALTALLYSTWDWILPKLFVDTFGLAFTENVRLKQLADLGGPSALTFLLAFVNVAVYLLYFEIRDRTEPSVYPAVFRNVLPTITAALLVVAAFVYGDYRYHEYRALETGAPRKISGAIIQANIGDIEKIAAERGYRDATATVMNTYYRMSDEAIRKVPKTEVLFWPETSYPSDFGAPTSADDFARDRTLIEYSARINRPVVFGGYYSDERKVPYNAAFYLTPTSETTHYFKTILLWFGETIPFADTFPWIRERFPMVGFFGRGPGPTTLPLLGVPTQPLICYEALFPWFTAEGVRKGARAILNFTNDSWFGEHGAPYYHFRLAQLRSIETRTPQVRITNTGISALILPSGTIEGQSHLFQAETIAVEIPILEGTTPTLMTRYGDWFARVGAMVALFFLLVVAVVARPRGGSASGRVGADPVPDDDTVND